MGTASATGWGVDRNSAEQLLKGVTRQPLAHVKTLSGGRNSRTYLLTEVGGKAWVVKMYRTLPSDSADRRTAEYHFLEHAQAVGLNNVARVVATDSIANASAFTFLPGAPLGHGATMNQADIEQMGAFIRNLNGVPASDSGLAPAAEACFSIGDHLALIDHRVSQLMRPESVESTTPAARDFVLHVLRPTWDEVHAAAIAASAANGVDVAAALDSRDLCVSPSDFGPHNTLRGPDGRLFFVDFEYSGIDDPAKLVCDTLVHPELAVSRELRREIKRCLCQATAMNAFGHARTQILWAPYLIKWACIVLNILVSPSAGSAASATEPKALAQLDHQLGLAARQTHRAKRVLAEGVEADV